MRLLISVFEKSKGPGKLLLVENEQIVDSIDHFTNFRGITKRDSSIFVIDKVGTIFAVEIKDSSIKITKENQISGIEDAHDLYALPYRFITSCTANSYAKDTKGNTYKPFLVDPFVLEQLNIDHQDLYHLNSFAPYKNGFLLSVFTSIPYKDDSRWRDRNAEGAIIFWNEYGFQEILANSLSQPHSIRVKNGKIYFCDSKKSEFCIVEKGNKQGHGVAPEGFIRGMDFYEDNIIVGHSKSRVMNVGSCGYSVFTIIAPHKKLGRFTELKGNFKEIYDLIVI